MVMQPVGPLPASTYWRRRGLILLGLVVLLVLLRSCGGSGGAHPKAKASPKPSVTPTVTASASPGPSVTTPPPVIAAGATCPDGALSLVVKADAATYAVGATPTFTLTIKNTSAVSCTRDLGSKAVSLRVISGSARTWDSDDCTTGEESSVATLKPGITRQVVTLTWSGKRSKPQCAGERTQAEAGTYQVTGTVGTLTSARVVFRFHA